MVTVVRRTAGRSSANRRHVDHSALSMVRGPRSARQCGPRRELPEHPFRRGRAGAPEKHGHERADDGDGHRAGDARRAERGTALSAEEQLGTTGVARRSVGSADSERASRAWWDADADDYLAEHGADIGEVDFLWCPAGRSEERRVGKECRSRWWPYH